MVIKKPRPGNTLLTVSSASLNKAPPTTEESLAVEKERVIQPALKENTIKDKVRIKLSYGITKNMQNFNSLRLELGLEVDGDKGQEDKLLAQAETWVDENLSRLLSDATNQKE